MVKQCYQTEQAENEQQTFGIDFNAHYVNGMTQFNFAYQLHIFDGTQDA